MIKDLRQIKLIRLLGFLRIQRMERPILFALILSVTFAINYLISFVSFRWDFSYGQAYTLSDSTKKILTNLDDLVSVKFFVSSDLPTRLIPLKNEVIDLLREYKKEGRGNIQLTIADPKKNAQAANEAKELGLPEIQFSQLEKDKYAVTSSFFGIALSFGSKKELLPQVTATDTLEYNITSAVYRLTKKELAKIGIIGMESTGDVQGNQLQIAQKILLQQFNVEPVDLSSASSLERSYKALLIFDQKEYNDEELKKLKDFLEKGGKAVIFANGVSVADDALTVREAKHNLFSLLSGTGLKLEKNLILSTAAELVNFGGGEVSFVIPYPFWVKTAGFNEKNALFTNVTQLTFPWGTEIGLEKRNDHQTEAIVKTTNKSWKQNEKDIVLNPQAIQEPSPKDLKEFTVAALSKNKKTGSQLILISSSRFIFDRFLNATTKNLEFVLNILNEFASSGALSGIRARAVNFYPLPDLSENGKDLFKYTSMLLLPFLFAIFGGFRLLRRR